MMTVRHRTTTTIAQPTGPVTSGAGVPRPK
jgi:hypothetical protein